MRREISNPRDYAVLLMLTTGVWFRSLEAASQRKICCGSALFWRTSHARGVQQMPGALSDSFRRRPVCRWASHVRPKAVGTQVLKDSGAPEVNITARSSEGRNPEHTNGRLLRLHQDRSSRLVKAMMAPWCITSCLPL